MKKWILVLLLLPFLLESRAQALEVGMETVSGPAVTRFKGDLAKMVGFSEIELSDADIDSALAGIDVKAPRWLKELFPGIRIEVDEEVRKSLSRNVYGVRFFARLHWIGGSFTISDPRLTEPQESKRLKNQIKAIRLSLAGKAEELAAHLALVAAADVDRVNPFFSKRYDLEVYLDVKQVLMGDRVLLEWGKNNTVDLELNTGLRFTADPSPVVDLGSVLFISERLDSLMEGGILRPVENTTDAIAGAVQNILFGKFRDPRVVPSMGWVLRGEVPVNFGGSFSVVAGTEFSIHEHLALKGTAPMISLYGFAGLRWNVLGGRRR